MHEGEKISYEWTLNKACKLGDQKVIKELTAIAPYSETDGSGPLDMFGIERTWSIVFDGPIQGRKSYSTLDNTEKVSPDYSETDFTAIDQGCAFVWFENSALMIYVEELERFLQHLVQDALQLAVAR